MKNKKMNIEGQDEVGASIFALSAGTNEEIMKISYKDGKAIVTGDFEAGSEIFADVLMETLNKRLALRSALTGGGIGEDVNRHYLLECPVCGAYRVAEIREDGPVYGCFACPASDVEMKQVFALRQAYRVDCPKWANQIEGCCGTKEFTFITSYRLDEIIVRCDDGHYSVMKIHGLYGR